MLVRFLTLLLRNLLLSFVARRPFPDYDTDPVVAFSAT